MNINVILLAGGAGTRLWPLSRSKHPKQFLSLHGELSMLQETVSRLSELKINKLITVCNEESRYLVLDQLKELGQKSLIILEPVGRNTAPAVTLGAMSIEKGALTLVLSADHVIKDKGIFTNAVNEAIPLANSGKLVTFGVVPTRPDTGYGYIKKGDEFIGSFEIEKFVEKPSEETAIEYIQSGEFLWNSGMFLFKSDVYLEELMRLSPSIYNNCERSLGTQIKDQVFLSVDAETFQNCPSESLDCAVMEKTKKGMVVPLETDWSDIGSWASLWEISEKDDKGNVIKADAMMINAKNSFFYGDKRLIAALEVSDLIVVDTKDALLVANKNHLEDIKLITKNLEELGRPEHELQREVYRPWGKYDSIDSGSGFQVKRITVNPGEKLSLQKHRHRSEHWIVVNGQAKVTNGEEVFFLNKNESTYIPAGEVHSLENPGDIVLEIIEVQLGSYLGEDDIIRISDIYGRD